MGSMLWLNSLLVDVSVGFCVASILRVLHEFRFEHFQTLSDTLCIVRFFALESYP